MFRRGEKLLWIPFVDYMYVLEGNGVNDGWKMTKSAYFSQE